MSVSFRGSVIRNVTNGQVVTLDEAGLRTIINDQFVPDNNKVIAQMQKALLPNHGIIYDYMCGVISKYSDEYDRIITAVHNSPEKSIQCVVEKFRLIDNFGNEYAEYMFPRYADNCYEYSLRDELDVRLDKSSLKSIVYQKNPNGLLHMDSQAIMFRNPGDVVGKSCFGHFDKLGDFVCEDLQACGIPCFQTSNLIDLGIYEKKLDHTMLCWIYGEDDYHFYRYEPQFGIWTHKPGMMIPRCVDEVGNVITNPSRCVWSKIYSNFGGYIIARIPSVR